ncbi:MAG TPA: UDPGP type 1 family protein, partial [Pirellulaceae bacterium]|nr:UDPGP type 1 family protein [Pirellulaceae bacterium]
MTTDDARLAKLKDQLQPIGQQHLVSFWPRLSAAEREQLAQQIEAIDVEEFRELQADFRQRQAAGGDEKSQWAALAARAESPPAMRLDGSGVPFTPDQSRSRGAELLRSGEVGMILVAGGLGTRLGFDQPKGLF